MECRPWKQHPEKKKKLDGRTKEFKEKVKILKEQHKTTWKRRRLDELAKKMENCKRFFKNEKFSIETLEVKFQTPATSL